jgi:hypothetical protein
VTEPHPQPAHELLGWLLGGGGLLAIGSGLKWLWDKATGLKNSRETKLEKREAEYVAKLEERLDELEQRIEDQGKEIKRSSERATLAGRFCIMALDELESVKPGSIVVTHGRQMLRREFPELFSIEALPASIRAQLEEIDARAAGGGGSSVGAGTVGRGGSSR